MLPSPLAVELPLRPRGIDLDSRYGSSHPPMQGPPVNGVAIVRDGGEQAGWTGNSMASGGQEHLEPDGAGLQPLLSLGGPSMCRQKGLRRMVQRARGMAESGWVEGHLDSEGWIGASRT
jgi:hypothetical protein